MKISFRSQTKRYLSFVNVFYKLVWRRIQPELRSDQSLQSFQQKSLQNSSQKPVWRLKKAQRDFSGTCKIYFFFNLLYYINQILFFIPKKDRSFIISENFNDLENILRMSAESTFMKQKCFPIKYSLYFVGQNKNTWKNIDVI